MKTLTKKLNSVPLRDWILLACSLLLLGAIILFEKQDGENSFCGEVIDITEDTVVVATLDAQPNVTVHVSYIGIQVGESYLNGADELNIGDVVRVSYRTAGASSYSSFNSLPVLVEVLA